ncbi:hypothetical protein IKU74_03190 [bacterium]|nr:hypothetical protein [bacterium]
MAKKFDIRKSFEIFLKEPLSILKVGLFQIVHLESNIFKEKTVNVDFIDNTTQVTVVNNERMYNLFQTVLFKRRLKEQQEKVLSLK